MNLFRILWIAVHTIIMMESSGQKIHKFILLQYDKKIDAIIQQMTLEEKVEMLHG